ncbi:LytR/AlgR family response regulator transcription factor [Anaerosacchariphilus polymeriproducens]|uniref:Stage 0 sporulation protein A homolog n=1 Tax=Anaerosacchariphilus polymeriproducens TaxID=1812858 RepID=A0A371AYG4_9FIRM|nr:LytTR family DNA-binding domain-containing protein [Anaerosacchariphilus polymeriproducens]RDU24635.1 DNA-binding response regulator [Anaerosacchariphilus polymeriproducens]
MMNVFICEDNPKQLKKISDIVNNVLLIEDLDLQLALADTNPHKILEKVKLSKEVGIYFFDIDLNSDLTGLTLAQEIRKYDPRGFIIFITTHSEMSYMTFMYKVEAMDFILKDDIDQIHTRIHQCILDAVDRYSSSNNSIQKNFTFKFGDKRISIDYNDIIYFETSLNVHKIMIHTKTRVLEFSGKLKEIADTLDERFYRCHRSFLINREHIKEIDLKNHVVHMSNYDNCLISNRLAKGLLDK